MRSPVERAIEIAIEAHAGQRDRAGQPYILHPLRVMLAQDDDASRVVAVLHDVVEDSDWTPDDLRREGFPEGIIVALDALTRREGEPYMDYIDRAGANQTAREVKIADLRDNGFNPQRTPPEHLLDRYAKALARLEPTPQSGNG